MKIAHPKRMVFLTALIGAGAIVWLEVFPRPPIEFLGEKPDARFAFKGEFQRKAAIDHTFPLIGRVLWPSPRQVEGDTTPEAYCGYLAWDHDPGDSLHFRSAGSLVEFRSYMATDGEDLAFRSSTKAVGTVTGLPFATDLAYRDVELMAGNDTWKIRLPVDRSQGPAIRKKTTFRAGPYTIKIEPEPWTLTTAPLVLGISADAPPNVKLLITLTWSVTGKGDRDEEMEQGWLLEGSAKTYTMIPRTFDGGRVSTGNVIELEGTRASARDLQKVGDDPFLHVLDEVKEAHRKDPDLIAIEYGAWWVSNVKPIRRFRLPNDETLTRYRAKHKWPYRFEVDAPTPIDVVVPESLRLLRMGMIVDRLNITQSVYNPTTGESLTLWNRPPSR